MKRLCAVLVMLVVWPAWADMQDATDAYNRGDYATAVNGGAKTGHAAA